MKKAMVITLAIVMMVSMSMMASAVYGDMNIDDDFTGTSLDSTTWTRENNISYSLSGGMLNIDIDDSSENETYLASTDYTHPQTVHAETKVTIDTNSIQTNNASFLYYTGLAFKSWNINDTDIDAPQVMGGIVGMERDGDRGILMIGITGGTGTSINYRTFEYGNSTNLFGQEITFEFVYDVSFSGNEGVAHIEIYMDGNMVNSLDSHIYNTTDNMVYAMSMEQEDTTVKGTISVDYVKVGAWTGEVGKLSETIPKESIQIFSLGVFLLTLTIGMAMAQFSNSKSKDTNKIIKGALLFSMILFTVGSYLAKDYLETIYGIEQWILFGAVTVVMTIVMWRVQNSGRLFK